MCSASIEADAAGALPTEFRIFKAGANETSKGTSIFDAQAAADVMAHYAREGVDLMVDLEHHWSENSAEARADAADARGWFKLELRNGELWAVDVRWTPDGARRLSERTQRYISPMFYSEKETHRIAWLVNVALVSNPATFGAAPLVAASKQAGKVPMSGALRAACYAVLLSALTRNRKHRKQC